MSAATSQVLWDARQEVQSVKTQQEIPSPSNHEQSTNQMCVQMSTARKSFGDVPRSDDYIPGRSICNFLRNHHGSVASSYQAVTHGTDASEGWQTSPPIVRQNTGALVQQPLSSIAVKVRHVEQQEIQTALERSLPWTAAAEIPLLSPPFLRKSHSHPTMR